MNNESPQDYYRDELIKLIDRANADNVVLCVDVLGDYGYDLVFYNHETLDQAILPSMHYSVEHS